MNNKVVLYVSLSISSIMCAMTSDNTKNPLERQLSLIEAIVLGEGRVKTKDGKFTFPHFQNPSQLYTRSSEKIIKDLENAFHFADLGASFDNRNKFEVLLQDILHIQKINNLTPAQAIGYTVSTREKLRFTATRAAWISQFLTSDESQLKKCLETAEKDFADAKFNQNKDDDFLSMFIPTPEQYLPYIESRYNLLKNIRQGNYEAGQEISAKSTTLKEFGPIDVFVKDLLSIAIKQNPEADQKHKNPNCCIQ